MTTAVFNARIAANGGANFLISFRLIGGETVFVAPSYNKELATANDASRMPWIITGDIIRVYKRVSTPQGPQISAVSEYAISEISSLTFFYDPAIHTDFTEEVAFGN